MVLEAQSAHTTRAFFLGAGLVGLILVIVGLNIPEQTAEPLIPPLSTPPPFLDQKTIIVHVSGAVVSPGVVTLTAPFGSAPYLAEAIEAAGGVTQDADMAAVDRTMNLARPIQDGDKVRVPFLGEHVEVKEDRGVGEVTTLSINTATKEQLLSLPGIGEARAEAIVASRPYHTLDELKSAAKIPASVIEKIQYAINFSE